MERDDIETPRPLSPQERKRRWIELGVMYLSMAGLTLGSVWLEGLWSGLAGASALIVALRAGSHERCPAVAVRLIDVRYVQFREQGLDFLFL